VSHTVTPYTEEVDDRCQETWTPSIKRLNSPQAKDITCHKFREREPGTALGYGRRKKRGIKGTPDQRAHENLLTNLPWEGTDEDQS